MQEVSRDVYSFEYCNCTINFPHSTPCYQWQNVLANVNWHLTVGHSLETVIQVIFCHVFTERRPFSSVFKYACICVYTHQVLPVTCKCFKLIQKNIFLHQLIIWWQDVLILCQPSTNCCLTSLCLSLAWWEPVSLCPPSLSFSGHCIYDSSKCTKALFCYWSGSFWFGLTARTISGTGGALQCTFHTAPAKSCKRDWFREVWHQYWLHDMKSY